jgi:PAS domain S-box-containing protein
MAPVKLTTRRKLVSLLLHGSFIAAVGATALTSYWIVRGIILSTLQETALLKVKSAGLEIDSWLNRRLGEVETISNSVEIRSMNWNIAEPFLQLEQDRLADFWMFILVNPDGTYATTRGGIATGKNVNDREYFKRSMKGESNVSDLIISRTTGKRQINISVPVWSIPRVKEMGQDRAETRSQSLAFYNLPVDEKPKVIGNLAGNIPLSEVTTAISATELGKGSYAFALDSQGVAIAHPNSAFTEGLKSLMQNTDPTLAKITRSMTERKKGIELVELDQKMVYVAYMPINRANWSVALVIPRENLEEQLNALNTLAAVMGGMLIVAMITALTQLKHLTEIRDRAAQEIALNNQLQATGQQLQSTLAYLGTILDNLADGLLVSDTEGSITCYNPALLKLFDLEGKPLNGESVQAIFGQDLVKLIEQSQDQATSSTEIEIAQGRIGKAVATSILDATGTKIGTVVLIHDITAEKEVDQMKTDFISTVSHELRTPLTSVLGFAKIIKRKLEEVIIPSLDTTDKKMQRTARQINDNIEIIVSEGMRLTALINDVLDIAKMEAGKVDWKSEPIQITEIVDRAIAATTALLQAKNLSLVQQFDAHLPELMGDRDRLIQVVINLLSNAIKFTESGDITCKITRQQDKIIVSITDSGIGISLEDQPKVFERFKQVGDTLTDKPTGTGLGLPICKQIIEHHQGEIWVESELGQGSTFSFSLPSTAATHVREIDFSALIQQLQQSHEVDATSKRILIVDDEAPIRALLRQQLEAEGYQVEEARNGKEAIHLAKQSSPHLIILDVMMPEMNGFDVAAVLRHDPQTMGIPLIILSIVDAPDRCHSLGIDRHLTKPINLELLSQEVESLIAQGKSPRKVLVVDENEATAKTLVEILRSKGFTAVEVTNDAELLGKVATTQPDMVIASVKFWEHSDTAQDLSQVEGLKNTVFLLVAEHHDSHSLETTHC